LTKKAQIAFCNRRGAGTHPDGSQPLQIAIWKIYLNFAFIFNAEYLEMPIVAPIFVP